MHRLFVALRPPLAMRQALLDVTGGVPGARWQSDEQLHLTLRFVGEVDRHCAEDIAAALAGIRGPSVELHVEGTGAFDRRGRVHSLWAGVRAEPALMRLHAAVGRALTRVGVPPESRAFRPHVTLARLAADRTAVEPWLTRTATLAPVTQSVDCMLLFESLLGREGASYHAIARYPLTG